MKNKQVLQTVAIAGSLLISLVTPSACAQCLTPPSGITSWWPADGNALDVVGRNTALLMDGATFGPGEAGQAFSLDGVSQYLKVSAPVGLPLGNSPRTVALWFRTPCDLSSDTDSALVQYGPPSVGQLFGLITSLNAPGKLYFYGNFTDLAGTSTIQPNTWYHGAVTFDGATLKLYLNGQLESSRGASLNTVLNADGLTVGYRPDTGNHWQGQLDEISIFGRALSDTEIQSIYSAGTAGMCKPQLLVPPSDQVIPCGSNVTFSVVATNSTLYQWQFNGTDIAGATNASLVLTNASSSMGGVYTVVVGDRNGYHLSASATLAFSFLDLHLYAGVTVKGRVGGGYSVEYTDSLTPPVQWTVLTNILSLPVTPYIYIDFDSAAGPKRFYRVVSQDCP